MSDVPDIKIIRLAKRRMLVTAKKVEPRPTIPIRGSIKKKREPMQKLDDTVVKVKLKVSHRR